jgi:hypothetical protein
MLLARVFREMAPQSSIENFPICINELLAPLAFAIETTYVCVYVVIDVCVGKRLFARSRLKQVNCYLAANISFRGKEAFRAFAIETLTPMRSAS